MTIFDRTAATFAIWAHVFGAVVGLLAGQFAAAWFCGAAAWFAWCWRDEMEKRSRD